MSDDSDSDEIPTIGTHRGVPLHDQQSPERLDLVRAEIDQVLAISDIKRLLEVCPDQRMSPESRLLAAAKLEALCAIATEDRMVRPKIDVASVRAKVPGLASNRCRCPTHYRSIFDIGVAPGAVGPVKRETELER